MRYTICKEVSELSGNRAIPQGYMTVGEVAKKMGVTVRTCLLYTSDAADD